jgi:hypothetical protein
MCVMLHPCHHLRFPGFCCLVSAPCACFITSRPPSAKKNGSPLRLGVTRADATPANLLLTGRFQASVLASKVAHFREASDRGRDGSSPLWGSTRPPRRSQRAGLPHWAPPLGFGVEALESDPSHTSQRTGRALPGSESGARFAGRVPLGQPPSSTASAPAEAGLFGGFAGVGSGEAADLMAATSARPSEPLVQFSRKRLSPD